MCVREFMGNCWFLGCFVSGLLALGNAHATEPPATPPPADHPATSETNSPEQLPAPKVQAGHSFRFAEFLANPSQVQSQSAVFTVEIPFDAIPQKPPQKPIVDQAKTSETNQPGSQLPNDQLLPNNQLAESKSHELVTTLTLSFEPPKGSNLTVPNPALESLLNQAWEPLILRGEQTAQWLVSVEGNRIPLHIRVASKTPAASQPSAMQLHIEVAIPSEDGKGMVGITPESVSKILKRLRQYERWLRSSAEEWKAVGASRDWRDGREAVARARLMAAKQKETERSLLKWTAIEELAEVIFQSARLEFAFE